MEKITLKILMLEDDPLDASLNEEQLALLEEYNCIIKWVIDKPSYLKALQTFSPDIVISDFNLPQYNGLEALKDLLEISKSIPFIMVTGTINEETAADTIKYGAWDYVVKERLFRLNIAIRNALKLKDEKNQNKFFQEQLFQTQKLESIGRFAGSIAHDLNNYLTPILGYTELLKFELTTQSQLESANEIIKGILKTSSLIKQLLIFARKKEIELVIINLNDTLRDFESLVKMTVRKNIEIIYNLDSNLKSIKADSGHFQQIIMNLCVNAQDAIQDNGSIYITTSNVILDKHYSIFHKNVLEGAYVLVSVGDTGSGMDKATIGKVFEPFFTTKEPGKGTGLGLATVYGIIVQFGGHIDIYSELGKGTTFKMYFPVI